jgi:hypothetical protein
MSSKLKQITTKAKALYKSGKYKKWTDAIKAASKTLTSTVKKVKVGAVKKKAAAKKVAHKKPHKKSPARLLHKDTKSHNVNIRVMSGINQAVEHLNRLINEKSKALGTLEGLKINLKNSGDKESIKHFKFWIARYKKFIAGLTKQITEAKKHIK